MSGRLLQSLFPPSQHCVLNLWFRKNYRLQDIQLSKTRTATNAAVRTRGGEYRDRTGDLLVANQALSQLS